MHEKSYKLGGYASGNASRDFFKNVKLPLDREWVKKNKFSFNITSTLIRPNKIDL